MELFTGAQCPPCVAADVAFDALARAYRPGDLILIQYHMHIPGPDPMTNPDTVGRWDYYTQKFPKNVTGTPTTLFNGKPFEEYDQDPTHRGGGPMANAENKFGQYRTIINGLLDGSTDVKATGSARRDGDKVTITAGAAGVKGDDVVLRLILLEESVKYVGGNGLRVHHDVVRAFPNGLKGTAVKDGSARATVEVNLAELRTEPGRLPGQVRGRPAVPVRGPPDEPRAPEGRGPGPERRHRRDPERRRVPGRGEVRSASRRAVSRERPDSYPIGSLTRRRSPFSPSLLEPAPAF